jgi:predicted site-specific integrase-resolvase
MSDALLTPDEAAGWLKVDVRTLEYWRIEGRGPDYVMLSKRKVRYEPSALERFIEQRRRSSREYE